MNRFLHVLVVRESEYLKALGPAAWAALEEIGRLFSRADRYRNVGFERVLLTSEFKRHWPALGEFARINLFRGSRINIDPESYRELRPDFWDEVRPQRLRRPQNRLVDQWALSREVRRILEEPETPIVLTTDVEIVPPIDWRYIISDSSGREAVVSTAPLDPFYWSPAGSRDSEGRIGVIKQRLRAAACGATGDLLGVKACSNPRCFFFEPVDSFAQLDEMRVIGPEHGIPGLTGLGFDADAHSPDKAQQPRAFPTEEAE